MPYSNLEPDAKVGISNLGQGAKELKTLCMRYLFLSLINLKDTTYD